MQQENMDTPNNPPQTPSTDVNDALSLKSITALSCGYACVRVFEAGRAADGL